MRRNIYTDIIYICFITIVLQSFICNTNNGSNINATDHEMLFDNYSIIHSVHDTLQSDSHQSISGLDSVVILDNLKWHLKIDSLTQLFSQLSNIDSSQLKLMQSNLDSIQLQYNQLLNKIDRPNLQSDTDSANTLTLNKNIASQQALMYQLDNLQIKAKSLIQQNITINDDLLINERPITVSDTNIVSIRTENQANTIQPEISSMPSDSTVDIQNQRIMEAFYTRDFTYLRSLITGFDKESLKQSWNQYQQVELDTIRTESPELLAVTESEPIQQKPSIDKKTQSTKTKKPINNNKKIAEKKSSLAKKGVLLIDLVHNEQISQLFNADSMGIEFAVQIFASRVPLTDEYINRKYKGKWPVKVREEEGWYKYQVGFTATYGEARAIRDTSEIPKAFIVPYSNNQKLILWEIIKNKLIKSKQQLQSIAPKIETDALLFVVQIAASRERLTDGYLKKIYSGNKEVREIKEDNWFKYQIVLNESFQSAKEFWKTNNIKNSFIAAYLNGVKTPMNEAISKSKNSVKK